MIKKISPILTLAFSASLSLSANEAPKEFLAPETKVKKLATGMRFTEGPVWLPEKKIVVFSDIPNSMLMQWSETDGLKPYRKSENSNGNIRQGNQRNSARKLWLRKD